MLHVKEQSNKLNKQMQDFFLLFFLQDLKVTSTVLDILSQIKEEAKFLATTTKYIHQKRERGRERTLGLMKGRLGVMVYPSF